jgi:hypothetical protein
MPGGRMCTAEPSGEGHGPASGPCSVQEALGEHQDSVLTRKRSDGLARRTSRTDARNVQRVLVGLAHAVAFIEESAGAPCGCRLQPRSRRSRVATSRAPADLPDVVIGSPSATCRSWRSAGARSRDGPAAMAPVQEEARGHAVVTPRTPATESASPSGAGSSVVRMAAPAEPHGGAPGSIRRTPCHPVRTMPPLRLRPRLLLHISGTSTRLSLSRRWDRGRT